MSALAIAGVTAVIKNLTQNFFTSSAMQTSLGATPAVSALPPDLAETLHADTDAVNYFMYRTAPNLGLQGEFNPVRNTAGERINRSPMALDLFYLLSAYGSGDMHAEILLGHAMQLFNENPVIDRAGISGALATPVATDAAIVTALINANIPDRLEQIRLAIYHPEDDWLSKLWGSFNAHFRPSVIFQASVILIEADISFQPGLPVQRYEVEALPMTLPHIDKVESIANPLAPISFGDDIRIRGSNLRSDITQVQIADMTLTDPDFSALSGMVIEIPGSALVGIQTGINAVQVLHQLMLGVPQVAHEGFQSNVVALILHPVITNITPSLTADSDGLLEGQIQVDLQPAVARGQRVNLLLNSTAATTPTGHSFSAPPRTADTPVSSLSFEVAGIDPGDYYIRIQVDGAANQLSVDPATRTINETPVTLS